MIRLCNWSPHVQPNPCMVVEAKLIVHTIWTPCATLGSFIFLYNIWLIQETSSGRSLISRARIRNLELELWSWGLAKKGRDIAEAKGIQRSEYVRMKGIHLGHLSSLSSLWGSAIHFSHVFTVVALTVKSIMVNHTKWISMPNQTVSLKQSRVALPDGVPAGLVAIVSSLRSGKAPYTVNAMSISHAKLNKVFTTFDLTPAAPATVWMHFNCESENESGI
jgi:hypothetical protein